MSGMRLSLPLAALAISVVALCGCSGSHFNFEGKWLGLRDFKAEPGQDVSILRTLAKIELNVKPNGKFELFEGGLPYDGSFRESGGIGYLRIQAVMNKPIESQGAFSKLGDTEIELHPTKDGDLDYVDKAGYDAKPIRLKRQAQRS